MKKYDIEYTDEAIEDIFKLKKSEKQAYSKLNELLKELREHPRTGTGKPKRLSSNRPGQWSRRMTEKHRLVYKIEDEKIIVLVLSAYGHYEDK